MRPQPDWHLRPTGLTILLTDKRKPAPLEDGALAGVTIRGRVQARRVATSVLDWLRIHEGPCRLPSRSPCARPSDCSTEVAMSPLIALKSSVVITPFLTRRAINPSVSELLFNRASRNTPAKPASSLSDIGVSLSALCPGEFVYARSRSRYRTQENPDSRWGIKFRSLWRCGFMSRRLSRLGRAFCPQPRRLSARPPRG